MTERARLEELVLGRVWTAPKRGISRREVTRALAPWVAQVFTPAEWSAACASVIEVLLARGELLDKPLRLSATGASRILAVLGLSGKPPSLNWRSFQQSLLVSHALGLPPAAAKSVRRREHLAAHLVSQKHGLGLPEKATMSRAVDAIVARELGLEPGERVTLSKVRARMISRVLGARSRGKPSRIEMQLAAHAAGAPRADAVALRRAVVRRWLSSPAAAPSPELDVFARAVLDAAQRRDAKRFGDDEVFIASAWDGLRESPRWRLLDLDAFKHKLVEANRAGLIRLNRADLVGAMDPAELSRSETHYLNATFHFVLLEG